jgi:gluconolactonase
MRLLLIGVLAAAVGAASVLGAQTPTESSASVDVFDPALRSLVSPAAKVETLKNEFFALVEGPVWVPEGQGGYLLFSDMPANCIYKWQDGRLSVFLEKSGFSGTDTSTAGLEVNNGRFQVVVLGSNALTLDRQGRLLIVRQGDRRLVRLEPDGTQTILAERYDGKRLNSPNDVVVKSNGSILFTDPGSGLRGGAKSPLKELPVQGIYLLKNGTLSMLDHDPQGELPNGLAFSPDERIFYASAFKKLVAYDVRPDDTIANPRVIFDYDTQAITKEFGFFDGLKVDTTGNIWGTGPGGIWVISPSGKALGRIRVPEHATNLTFGDHDGKTLYITARRGLYRIRLQVAGIRPTPDHAAIPTR